jgi:hypothetical protein
VLLSIEPGACAGWAMFILEGLVKSARPRGRPDVPGDCVR